MEDNGIKVVAVITFIIAFLCVGLPMASAQVDTWIIVLVILIAWFLLFILGLFINIKYQMKQIDNEYDSVGFNKEKGRLTVYKRGALSESKITVKEYKHTNYSYNSAKLIYTSATVGGVTTGGFDTTKASYSPTSQDKTGKYELCFRGEAIRELDIVCDNAKAKQNSILKNFYNKEKFCFVLEHQIVSKLTPYERQKLREAVLTNDYQTMSGLTKEDTIAKKLTYDECQAIKAWIGGKD